MAISPELGVRRTVEVPAGTVELRERGDGPPVTAPRSTASAHARRLAELLPEGRFEIVERSRTFIPEDNPQPLAGHLREFLATTTRSRP